MEQKKFDDYLKSLNTFLHIMKWTWQRTFSQQQLMKVYFDWSNINKNEDLFLNSDQYSKICLKQLVEFLDYIVECLSMKV